MTTIDTNVLVRVLVRDDEAAYAQARALVSQGTIVVVSTVLLEAEWVLRSTYGMAKERVLETFSAFLALPGVEAREPVIVDQAIGWSRAGLDFADALHLAQTAAGDVFATFDNTLRKRASDNRTCPQVDHPRNLVR